MSACTPFLFLFDDLFKFNGVFLHITIMVLMPENIIQIQQQPQIFRGEY